MNSTIKKYFFYSIPLFFILIFLSSCGGSGGSKTSPELSSDKAMSFFGLKAENNPGLIEDISAVFDGVGIIVTVPVGTDVTGLVASFTATSEEVTINGVEQISDITSNDFTAPVTYTVAAEDGTSSEYTITVCFEAEILSFSFTAATNAALSDDVTGVIDGTYITLIVPYDVDFGTLVAGFTHNGTSLKVGEIEQVSGTTIINFSNPVTYTLTGQNGLTVDYSVTVKPDRKTIELFDGDAYPHGFCTYNDKLYFIAKDSDDGVYQIWVFDGENAPVKLSGFDYKEPKELTVYDGKLYFQGKHIDTVNGSGTELWVYDGSTATVIDIYPGPVKSKDSGPNSSYPEEFAVYDGKLFFQANSGDGGDELHSYDSSTGSVVQLGDIDETGSSQPRSLTVFAGKLYFSADDGLNPTISGENRELWVYDSTTEGPTLAADITNNLGNGDPKELIVYNDKLYFSADDLSHGRELWVFDGAAATLAEDIYTTKAPPAGSRPESFCVYDSKLYFAANDGGLNTNLWAYDSVSETAVKVKNSLDKDIYEPYCLVEYQGQLFFNGKMNSGMGNLDLWSFNGVDFLQISAYAYGSNPEYLFVFNDILCFATYDEDTNNSILAVYRE